MIFALREVDPMNAPGTAPALVEADLARADRAAAVVKTGLAGVWVLNSWGW
jgi:hypothetical protein